MMLLYFLLACNVFDLGAVQDSNSEPTTPALYQPKDNSWPSEEQAPTEPTVEEATEETQTTDSDGLEESDLIIDTGHPVYDTDGSPLYPTIPEDFEETGLLPSPENSRTIEDCNVPDDFMLVTYLDLDQDGFGTEYDTRTHFYNSSPCYGLRHTMSHTGGYLQSSITYDKFFSTSFAVDYEISPCDTQAPPWDKYLVRPIDRLAISLFPEIYNETSGLGRLTKALEVINQEGGLPYELTAQAAITTYRKQFRDELIYIAEQRCAANQACFNTNYISWDYAGFNSKIFLTFSQDIFIAPYTGEEANGFSPFIATFWLGDEGTEHGYSFYNPQERQSYIVDAPYDTMPELNEGFFICSWFSDDADGDGWTLEEGDCNDGARWISPNAPEIPNNNVDNNCDGFELCYSDEDNDGFYGITSVFEVQGLCPQVPRPSDCNDNDSDINPDAPERPCDGIDSDCTGRDEM